MAAFWALTEKEEEEEEEEPVSWKTWWVFDRGSWDKAPDFWTRERVPSTVPDGPVFPIAFPAILGLRGVASDRQEEDCSWTHLG